MKSFSELTGKEKGIELLRWICVLPAVMLASYLSNGIGGLLVRLAVSAGLINPPSDMAFTNTCLRYLIWLFPQGLACVIAGAKTAPRRRRAIACILALLWCLLVNSIHRWADYTVIPTTVAAVCGIAYIFYSERTRKKAGPV